MERILPCNGPLCAHKYLIRWKNYQQEDDTWDPHTNLHPVTIKEFELENILYDHSSPFRCPVCDLSCNSERGVKVYTVKTHDKNDVTVQNEQVYKGSLTDKEVRIHKIEDQQDQRPTIYCENEDLENVFEFRYLGGVFAADGFKNMISRPT